MSTCGSFSSRKLVSACHISPTVRNIALIKIYPDLGWNSPTRSAVVLLLSPTFCLSTQPYPPTLSSKASYSLISTSYIQQSENSYLLCNSSPRSTVSPFTGNISNSLGLVVRARLNVSNTSISPSTLTFSPPLEENTAKYDGRRLKLKISVLYFFLLQISSNYG